MPETTMISSDRLCAVCNDPVPEGSGIRWSRTIIIDNGHCADRMRKYEKDTSRSARGARRGVREIVRLARAEYRQEVATWREATRPLHPRKERAIQELLHAPTLIEAAKRAGVNEKTIRRWMKQYTFSARLQAAQEGRVQPISAETAPSGLIHLADRVLRLAEQQSSEASPATLIATGRATTAGMIYRPRYRRKDGTTAQSATWWMKYYENGEARRENCHTTDEWRARDILSQRRRKPVAQSTGGIMVRFYKQAINMQTEVCLETDAPDERAFLEECARLLPGVLGQSESAAETRDWIRRVVDVSCKLRGYKADVVERRVIQAGSLHPSDEACVGDSREGANGAALDEETTPQAEATAAH